MKNIRTALLLILLCLTATAQAQQLQELRRSKRPFAFAEFKEAKVNQPFGRYTKAKVNFRLSDGALCFLDKDSTIRRAYVQKVLSVDVDSVRYLKVDSIFGRVLASQNYNHLVCVTLIDQKYRNQELFDIDQMMQNGGGFFAHSILELEEKAGEGYPLKDVFYFNVQGTTFPARESYVKKHIAPEYKTAFRTLMGDRWWSWHDPDCLAKLLMYFPK